MSSSLQDIALNAYMKEMALKPPELLDPEEVERARTGRRRTVLDVAADILSAPSRGVGRLVEKAYATPFERLRLESLRERGVRTGLGTVLSEMGAPPLLSVAAETPLRPESYLLGGAVGRGGKYAVKGLGKLLGKLKKPPPTSRALVPHKPTLSGQPLIPQPGTVVPGVIQSGPIYKPPPGQISLPLASKGRGLPYPLSARKIPAESMLKVPKLRQMGGRWYRKEGNRFVPASQGEISAARIQGQIGAPQYTQPSLFEPPGVPGARPKPKPVQQPPGARVPSAPKPKAKIYNSVSGAEKALTARTGVGQQKVVFVNEATAKALAEKWMGNPFVRIDTTSRPGIYAVRVGAHRGGLRQTLSLEEANALKLEETKKAGKGALRISSRGNVWERLPRIEGLSKKGDIGARRKRALFPEE